MTSEVTGEGVRGTREYPSAPIVGVAGVVVDRGRVLLIRRGREPMKGAWSLPGGALEVGETMARGVEREVLEETGLAVEAIEVVATLDRIVRDESGRVRYHYVLVDWVCRVLGESTVSGEAEGAVLVAGDDAEEAAWVGVEELGLSSAAGDVGAGYELGEVTLRVIGDALRRAEGLGL